MELTVTKITNVETEEGITRSVILEGEGQDEVTYKLDIRGGELIVEDLMTAYGATDIGKKIEITLKKSAQKTL